MNILANIIASKWQAKKDNERTNIFKISKPI